MQKLSCPKNPGNRGAVERVMRQLDGRLCCGRQFRDPALYKSRQQAINTNFLHPPLHFVPLSVIISTILTPIYTFFYLPNSISSYAYVILVNGYGLNHDLCLPEALPQSAILITRPSTLRVNCAFFAFSICVF
jgi:hypothetical protein